MKLDNYYLLIFNNTLEAMEGENVLKGYNIPLVIMPTPTSITKSCGIGIRIENPYVEKIVKLKEQGKIKIKNIYVEEDSSYRLYI
jgi:hypothetical protein